MNTTSHLVVVPKHRLFLLLLYKCNFATVINYNIKIRYVDVLRWPLGKGPSTLKGLQPPHLEPLL